MNSWGQNPALASGISSGKRGNGCWVCGLYKSWQRTSHLTHLAQGGELFILSQRNLHGPPRSPWRSEAAQPEVEAAESQWYHTWNCCNFWLSPLLVVLFSLLCWSLSLFAKKRGWRIGRSQRQRLKSWTMLRKVWHTVCSEKLKQKEEDALPCPDPQSQIQDLLFPLYKHWRSKKLKKIPTG